MIEEQQKTVTQEAYEKCREGNGYLVIPNSVMTVSFIGMSDMEDGLGGYHSLQTLKETLPFSWGATSLTDDLVFVHYCFDEDSEKSMVISSLESMGLIEIRQDRKVTDLVLSDLVANGFMICSPREIKKLQILTAESNEV